MKIRAKILTEIISMVALAGVLEFVSGFLPFTMPEGGRITLAAMIPIFFVAVRRGPRIGILAGIAFGLVVLIEVRNRHCHRFVRRSFELSIQASLRRNESEQAMEWVQVPLPAPND